MPNGDCRQRLSNFYSVLNQALHGHREATRRLDRFLSTGFNVFSKVIRPDENRLSEIVADLLNPSGSHGQDRRFLDAFLQLIKPNALGNLFKQQPSSVTCESRTIYIERSQRRIDILLAFENFGLAIENKPWAADQEEQLQDYSGNLQKNFKDKFCLLYLTWEGIDPDEKSIARNLREELKKKGKLICISYRHHILKWIEECCRLCESDKFRWFLRDFMDYINGGQTMAMRNEREITLAHALERENLGTTLDIGLAFPALRERIIVGFLDKLEKFVLDKLKQRPDASEWGIFIEDDDHDLRKPPLKRYQYFGFGKISWKKQYGVALQPQSDNAGDVIIGIWRQYDEKTGTGVQRIDLLFQELNNIRNGKHSDWWEWYHFLEDPYRNWNTKEALIKLHNGEAVEHIGSKLGQIINVAAPIIDEHVRGS